MKKLIYLFLPAAYLFFLLFQTDLGMLGDLGRHLKVGEVVLSCHCVPQTNLFSYTHPDFAIVNHEWLGEVIFYLVSSVFGLTGLLIFKSLLISCICVLMYRLALKHGTVYWATIFSMLFLTIFSMRFHTLPEMYSYLFLAVFMVLLENAVRTKKFHLLWFLPLLEIIWVNTHIYFILGVLLYGFFLIEYYFKHKKLEKSMIVIGIGVLFAPLLNPSFLTGALLPFTFSHNYGVFIEENQSLLQAFVPTSTTANIAFTLILQLWVFIVLLIMFLASCFVTSQWKTLSWQIRGILGSILSTMYIRCVPLFGLLSFVPLVSAGNTFEKHYLSHLEETMRNTIKGFLLFSTILVALVHIGGLFSYHVLTFSYAPSAENAVAFVKKEHLDGNIFNNYIIGNYLVYQLYPEKRVFIDARPEAYPASFFDEYNRMLTDPTYFKTQAEKYALSAVVFNVAQDDPVKVRPFLLRLLQGNEWVPVYGDGIVTIFVRDLPQNKTIIEKYRIRPTSSQ